MNRRGAFHAEVRDQLARGETAAALRALHDRIRDEPGDAWAHLYLATLLPADDAARAATLALRAVELAPADLELRAGALEVLLEAGMVDEARAALATARAQVTGETPVALVAQLTGQGAAVLAFEGRHDEALQAFAVARRLEPGNPRWAASAELVLRRFDGGSDG